MQPMLTRASDSIDSERWRSETLTAMIKTDAFQAREKTSRKAIYNSFLQELKTLSPSIVKGRGSRQTLDNILGLAIDLHKAIRCSRENYRMRKPSTQEIRARGDLNTMKQWTLKDLETWMLVTADEDFIPGKTFLNMTPKPRTQHDCASLDCTHTSYS